MSGYPGSQRVGKSHQVRRLDPDAMGSDVQVRRILIVDSFHFRQELADEIETLKLPRNAQASRDAEPPWR